MSARERVYRLKPIWHSIFFCGLIEVDSGSSYDREAMPQGRWGVTRYRDLSGCEAIVRLPNVTLTDPELYSTSLHIARFRLHFGGYCYI